MDGGGLSDHREPCAGQGYLAASLQVAIPLRPSAMPTYQTRWDWRMLWLYGRPIQRCQEGKWRAGRGSLRSGFSYPRPQSAITSCFAFGQTPQPVKNIFHNVGGEWVCQGKT